MTTSITSDMNAVPAPNLSKAFAAFWGAVKNAPKDRQNPHHKNDYATLESVLSVIKPAAEKHGLAFPQFAGAIVDGKQQLTTLVVHESGELWTFTAEMPMPDGGLDKKTQQRRPASPQQGGITLTYLRRYALMAIAGIAPIDTDGEGAVAEDDGAGGAEPDPDEVEAIKAGIIAFKAKKNETPKEAIDRFTTQFKERVQAAGDESLGPMFVEMRAALKKG